MNNQKTCGNMSTTSYKRDCSMDFCNKSSYLYRNKFYL